jgi:hypothetical protein
MWLTCALFIWCTVHGWKKNPIDRDIKEQLIQMLDTIMEQNYFQYNNQYFKPEKGIAMGSPISGTLAEIYLQLIEERHIKHWIEEGNIVYYKRYVDDIFIIFDASRINETIIKQVMNSIDKHLEFKITESINYLDMTINRNKNRLEISIYRKPTSTNITIHQTSNHPQGHKDAAYRYYIHRMITLPNTNKAGKQEQECIFSIAQHNGYSKQKNMNTKQKERIKNKDTQTKNSRFTRRTDTEKMGDIYIP